MRRFLIVVVATLAAAPSGAALAQVLSAADTALVEIEGTSVQGTRPLATRGGSSAFRAELDSLPVPAAASLEQVLRQLPAVHVRTNSRGEAELSVRGSESRQVAVLLDGIPLTLSWDGRTDVSVIPVGAVQEVTLVRGLTSLLSGPNVLGGVIEFQSSASAARPGPPSLQLRAGADQEGGFGTSASITAPRALAGGVLTLRAGAGHRDAPGVPLAGAVDDPASRDGLRTNTDQRATDGFAAVRYDRPDGAWASLASSAFRTERGIAAELGVSQPRFWRYPFVARSLTVLSGGSGLRNAPWGGVSSLQASFGLDVGRNEIDAFDAIDYRTRVSQEDGSQRTLSMRALGRQTLGRNADLRLGVTSSELTYDESLTPGGTLRYRHRLWNVAGETTVRFPLEHAGPLDEFDLSAGVAFDRSVNPLAGDKPAVEPREAWGARAGLSAELFDGTMVAHLSANRRARFPSLRELYSGSLGRFTPNPDLQPERLTAIEGGVTLRDARGTLQLVGFHQRLDDAVVRIRVSGRFKRVNQEGLESVGAELIGSRRLGGLTLAGDLTAQTVDLLDPTAALEHPENLPELSGGVRAELELPRRFVAGAGARFKGDQYALHPDTGELQTLGARAMVALDLDRAWAVGAGGGWFSTLHTRLAVENLTDAVGYDAYGLPEPGRSVRFEMRLQ